MHSSALNTCMKCKDVDIIKDEKTETLPVISVEQYRVEKMMYTIPI